MNAMPMHFASPEFSALLWLWLALTALLVWLERRGSGALDRLVAPALQEQLVERPAHWRRWLRVALLSLAGLFMVLALMRPQWGLRFIATPRVGAEIMIALDVSRSMLADDAKPSRLGRAKAEIADLLTYLDEDHVGLIAFAGRASVLSPMTPDRSFLRLVLDGAGPGTIARGGTNLAEPILRAVRGLGEPGPAQRALILITDGEDHDSFALDAAKQAAEAGIKIIAIGFGAEAGSQIYITDPRTGARTRLRDSGGEPVVSRLDGEFLREIALATDGAYVPAGTGVLDLASIYDEHIAGLTRSQLDRRGRSIRDEMYGWFVLLALLCLVAAVAIAAGRGETGVRSATGAAALVLALWLALPMPVGAQTTRSDALAPRDEPALAPAAEAGGDGDEATLLEAAIEDSERPAPAGAGETPREQFNRATELLDGGDPGAAEPLLREARRRATDDGVLRYAATYNLGIATVARAETVEETDPRRALDALYEAADWFRGAIALRPADDDARHNLEVALRKALILADFLARSGEGEIAAELDALLKAQRERVTAAAMLLEQVAGDGELDAAELLRPAFAEAATQQRTLLADASDLAERAAQERDAIAAMSEQERTPQDAMRGAQLSAVLQYLDAALDRMGQARSQLRRRSAERAYRRSSAALAELSRARDQLRDPVEQIGVLLAEVGGLMRSSAALAAAGQVLPGGGEPRRTPAFLTPESARLDSDRVRARVEELGARLEAGLAAASQRKSDPAAAAEPSSPEEEALLAAVAEASPHVAEATGSLAEATGALGEQRYAGALESEGRAGEALAEARERFFDLRQLIEAAYQDQRRIAEIASSDDPAIANVRDEYASALRELQSKNSGRGERLEGLLERERQQLEAALAEAANDPAAAESNSGASETGLRRIDAAGELLARSRNAMEETRAGLGDESAAAKWPEASTSARAASDQLERLRALFFSIVEHVRELLRLQTGLADRTRDAAALAAAEAPTAGDDTTRATDAPDETDATGTPDSLARGPKTRERAAALSGEQLGLGERSGTIGDALARQAEQTATAPPEQAGPDAEEAARRLRLAGEHVVTAQLAMGDAGAVLSDQAEPLQPALEHQTAALEELAHALELLVPPEQQQDQQDRQDQQQQDQQQPAEQQQSGDEEAAASENAEAEPDPSQQLQGVRDREAERRRERERGSSRYEPVEKDW